MNWDLEVRNRYPVGADDLFRVISDLDQLDFINRPLLQFDHLPSGLVQKGQVIEVEVSILGLVPSAPYQMRILSLDPKARSLRTEERGMGVSRLVHDIDVDPDESGSILRERISVSSGWRYPFIWAALKLLFYSRHRRRLDFLRQLERP